MTGNYDDRGRPFYRGRSFYHGFDTQTALSIIRIFRNKKCIADLHNV